MAPVTMASGPHSHQWSTAGTATVTGSSERSLPGSSRPLNSSTSCGSRLSTWTRQSRAG